jgi:NADPH:quinone reductase-like Zn-dependent oxidoreductase
MKAASYSSYGPPETLKVMEIERPIVGPGQVRIRVIASTVTSGDTRIRGFKNAGPFWLPLRLIMGVFGPRERVPGMEYAGIIDSLGANTNAFSIGDEIYGMGMNRANAEFLVVNEQSAICHKPSDLTFQEAAGLPFGGLSAIGFLRDVAKAQAGERLLVYGASGAVGVAAVQIGKALGLNVTAVCSRRNRDLVETLGADLWLDYNEKGFWARAGQHDIVLDTIGVTRAKDVEPILSEQGRHVYVAFSWGPIWHALLSLFRKSKKVICGFTDSPKADLFKLDDLVRAGLVKAVIDRSFGLEDIALAHEYVDTGRKTGAVVIEIGEDPTLFRPFINLTSHQSVPSFFALHRARTQSEGATTCVISDTAIAKREMSHA